MADVASGTWVSAYCGRVLERVEHAQKHLAEVVEQVQIIEHGEGLDTRLDAINAAATHCGVVVSDMQRAIIELKS
jgi:hypothetical protein